MRSGRLLDGLPARVGGGWIRKSNAAVGLIAIENALHMPYFRRTRRSAGRVVALFGYKNLHANARQYSRAMKEDRAAESSQQKLIPAELCHQHPTFLGGVAGCRLSIALRKSK